MLQTYQGRIISGKPVIGEDVILPENANIIVTVLEEPPEAVPKMSREEVFGCMRGQIWMADDFDEPLEDFAEYME